MRYSLVKVLLTMSPFRPSYPMRLQPFPHSPRAVSPLSTAFLPRAKPRGTPASTVSPLSTAFTPNRPLTPLSTAFTQTDRGGGGSRPPDIPTSRPAAVVLLPANAFLSYGWPSCSLFCAKLALCFQSFAASFRKTAGEGIFTRVDPGVPGTAKPTAYLGNPS